MKKLLLIHIILLHTYVNVSAQNYMIHHYNCSNGLISASNGYIIQDSTGFFWQCCFGGLVRFDGTDFKSFDNSDGLSFYNVTHIFEEQRNKFWVCNKSKLFAFDGHKFKDTRTNLPKDIEYNKIERMASGDIILITNNGCYKKYNDTTYQRFTLSNIESQDISELEEYAPKKIILFKKSGRQLCHIVNGHIVDQVQMKQTEPNYSVYSMNETPYITFENKTCQIIHHQLIPFLPPHFTQSTSITSIYQDKQKNIWFSDATYRLWQINKEGIVDFTSTYRTNRLVAPKYIEDRNNNLLIGYDNGLYVFRESLFKEVSMKVLKSNDINFISSFYGKDSLCCGATRNELILLVNGKEIRMPIHDNGLLQFSGSKNCYIHKTKFPNKFFLFVRESGMYYLQHNELTPFTKLKVDLSNISLAGIYDSAMNCCYTGIGNKLLRISPNQIDTIEFSKNKSLHPHSYQLMPDGRLYFLGTHKFLFCLYNNKIENVTEQLNLEGNEVSLASHKNQLWLLVHGIEIRVYNQQGDKLELQKKITKKNGLMDANFNSIKFDDDGNIWINAFTGLYYLKNHLADAESFYYSKKIPIQIGGNEAPLLDNINYCNNLIYTVGEKGMLIINTRNALFETSPIKTYFSAIQFNGKNLDDLIESNTILFSKNVYEFPSSYSSAMFHLSTIYYGYDNAIQYEYKLEGQDEDWKAMIKTNTISFNNLSNGKYTLSVRSKNQFNSSSFTEATFKFMIRPPYYKTWWFRALISLCTIGLIVYLILQRDKQKLNENKLAIQMSELKLETLQSQMNPHFIFNALNSIQNYILNNNQIEAARYLSKFSKLIRKTLDNSHHQFIPLEEIIQMLNMYLELEAFRFSNEFTYTINMEEKDDRIFNIELPPMLLQPFVENAILHGLMPKQGTKNVDVHVYIEANQLHCVIEDNGVGRSDKIKKEGHISRGQKLTEGMLESLKHLKMSEPDITFVDKKNESGEPLGTIVHIRIPIEN